MDLSVGAEVGLHAVAADLSVNTDDIEHDDAVA